MSTLSTLLLLGAVHGAIVVSILLASRQNQRSNRFLAALLFLVSLKLVPYVLGFSGYYDRFPWLSYAPFELESGFGPLLYLYVLSRTQADSPRRWYLHLVPLGIEFIYYLVVFLQPLDFKNAWHGRVQVHVDVFDNALGFLSIAVYLVLALGRTRAYQQFTQQNHTQGDPATIRFLRTILITFGAFLALRITFQIVGELSPVKDYITSYPFYLGMAVVIYVLGTGAIRYSEPLPSLAEPSGEPTAPMPKDWAKVARQIEARAITLAVWRDPELSLQRFADQVQLSPSYVSKALNNGLGESFSEFINRHRVADLQARLADPTERRDMLEQAFEVGFNSKASFNRIFKQVTGETPTAYRQRHLLREGPGP